MDYFSFTIQALKPMRLNTKSYQLFKTNNKSVYACLMSTLNPPLMK